MVLSVLYFTSTNLPKEIMQFRDYPIAQSPRSYILSHEFLSYVVSYAEHFQLNQLIQFKHHVTRVRPIDGTKWEVHLMLNQNLLI